MLRAIRTRWRELTDLQVADCDREMTIVAAARVRDAWLPGSICVYLDFKIRGIPRYRFRHVDREVEPPIIEQTQRAQFRAVDSKLQFDRRRAQVRHVRRELQAKT